MELIEDEIRSIVAEVGELDPALVSAEGTLSEAGVDSLLQVEIAVEIERRYRIRFDEDELKQLSSFASLVTLTREKLAAAAEPG